MASASWALLLQRSGGLSFQRRRRCCDLCCALIYYYFRYICTGPSRVTIASSPYNYRRNIHINILYYIVCIYLHSIFGANSRLRCRRHLQQYICVPTSLVFKTVGLHIYIYVFGHGINGRDFSTVGHQRVSNLHHALQTRTQLSPNTYYIAASPMLQNHRNAPPPQYMYMYVDQRVEIL